MCNRHSTAFLKILFLVNCHRNHMTLLLLSLAYKYTNNKKAKFLQVHIANKWQCHDMEPRWSVSELWVVLFHSAGPTLGSE